MGKSSLGRKRQIIANMPNIIAKKKGSTQERHLLTEIDGVTVTYMRADSDLDSDIPFSKFLF